jgi:hypothetical protein
VPFAFGEDAKKAGALAQVSCIVQEGDLPLQIIWTFHGKTIEHGSQTGGNGLTTFKIGDKTSILTIGHVTDAHSGVYRCLARNAVGENSQDAELLVTGRLL